MDIQDRDYMRLALALALKAKGLTSPNPLVGAVVVRDKKIIGKGFHKRCGSDHAEIIALKAAGFKAKGATLYVTLEPCGHFGQTPPCVDFIIKSGIKRVVVGTEDPNPIMNGKSILKMRRAGIKVDIGCIQGELKKTNEHFFKFIQQRIPFVVVKWGQTVDGKIATSDGASKWITSVKSREQSHRVRDEFDAILVGINTVLKDNPYLNAKRKSKRIKKIIVDSRLRIPLNGNLYQKTHASDIFIATTENSSKKRRGILLKKGLNVIVCPSKNGLVDLKFLLKKLASLNISSVLIEGGSSILGNILKMKLADKAYIFIAPRIMGDQRALSAVDGLKIRDIHKLINLTNLKVSIIDEDLFVEAYIDKEK